MQSDSDRISRGPPTAHGIAADRYRSALAVAPAGLAIVEPDRRIGWVNAHLCGTTGFTEAELVGTRVTELVHPDEANLLDARLDALEAGPWPAFSIEVRLENAARQAQWGVLSAAAAGAPGKRPWFVVHLLDTTAAKTAERRLARYAAELERSNQELDQLAAVVSHDLQAPLRTLSGYAELLFQEYGTKLDEQGQRWLNYVLSSAVRMHLLIGDLLKVARVQAQSSPVVPTELGPVVARAWERVAYVYAGANPEFVCGALPTVPVDEIQIEQVFQNLFDNALKYRRSDVRPRVEVRSARSGDDWQFSVCDNGIGLDMSQAGRIFDIFQRLHPDGAYSGTGIGLSVCRKIVERHHGRIWVESAPGRGAAFHFTIPASSWPPHNEADVSAVQSAGS